MNKILKVWFILKYCTIFVYYVDTDKTVSKLRINSILLGHFYIDTDIDLHKHELHYGFIAVINKVVQF